MTVAAVPPGGVAAGLTFRPMGPQDAPAVHAIVSDWRVARQLGSWPWPPDPAFTAGRCRPFEGLGFAWAVLDEGRLIGTIGVSGASLGYMFDLASAGRGIATAAVGIALAEARRLALWPLIRAVTWHDNPASRRVLEKHGFEHWSTRYLRGRARRGPALARCHRLALGPAA